MEEYDWVVEVEVEEMVECSGRVEREEEGGGDEEGLVFMKGERASMSSFPSGSKQPAQSLLLL